MNLFSREMKLNNGETTREDALPQFVKTREARISSLLRYAVSIAALSLFLLTSCSQEKPSNPAPQNTNNVNTAKTTFGSSLPLQFPKDEGWHPEAPIEWWYLNSQFSDKAGRKYAFFLAKFSTGRHLVSLFDKAADKTIAKDYYEQVEAAKDKVDLSSITGKWKQTGPFQYSFYYDWEGLTLDLTMKANKKPFLPGGEGFIGMGEKGTSFYYALTDITVNGTLKTSSNSVELLQVSGKAWMDHQWGSWDWINDFSQWKWYSIQLDNGVDLMLFNLYKNTRLINSHCGYIDAENNQFHKLPCKLVTKKYYTDERGGKWQKEIDLEIPSLPGTKLTLVSEKDDQFIERFVLWEGTMNVEGTFKNKPVKGTAYGELNRPDN